MLQIFKWRTCMILFTAMLLAMHISAASSHQSLDPTRTIASPRLIAKHHRPLREEYIWTANDAAASQRKIDFSYHDVNARTLPHYFRDTFKLTTVPHHATLYIAGPRVARIYINGSPVGELHTPRGNHMVFRTLSVNVRPFLRSGDNVLAMDVVRGWGVHHHTNSAQTSQLNFGEVLVAKIVPATEGVIASPVVVSSPTWKSTLRPGAAWEQPAYDDSSWPSVQSLGPIESNIDFFQWNADAGLYEWPGYMGEAPYMANYTLPPSRIVESVDPAHALRHAAALLYLHTATTTSVEFSVFPQAVTAKQGSPSLVLDFGREVNGRVEIMSDTNVPIAVTLQYGESIGEAEHAPFLGANTLTVPARGVARGPKSAFRYVLLHFPQSANKIYIRQILLDGIYYPARYVGSFQSSDALLNRIWETGAYTAHLCMQDSLWDAPKRDRGRWMGDMEVSGHTISDIFDDTSLLQNGFDQLIGPSPVKEQVNGIPGYSAFWIMGLADYYRHHDAENFLASVRQRLLELLHVMDTEINQRGLYEHLTAGTDFVDWSMGLNKDTPESRRALQFEYVLAYKEAAWLLHESDDNTDALYWRQRAQILTLAAQRSLLDPVSGTFGDRWQTNAMAVLSGATSHAQDQAIWSRVLSTVTDIRQPHPVITPYYGYYVLRAMARTDHRREALEWIRQYWGGMLAEGATSFWEAYDPSWPKKNFHAFLQADNKTGYYVSLAHGWSSGPTAWLTEQILGIQPTAAGFRCVQIRPDLAGLSWAKGSIPTPHGLLHVDLPGYGKGRTLILDLPPATEATLLMPTASATNRVYVNGLEKSAVMAENGKRLQLQLRHPGHYRIQVRQ